VRGRCGSFNAYADILIGFFMLATFDYAGCRRAVPNAGASGRIADAPSAMSPAPRAVRDVELAALKPGTCRCFFQPPEAIDLLPIDKTAVHTK